MDLNPLDAELKPICHRLAFLGAHHILHVSRIRVKGRWYGVLYGLSDACCNALSEFCEYEKETYWSITE